MVNGTFPVTGVMTKDASGTLTKAENPTVMTMGLLLGEGPGALASSFICTNRMPTTLPSYTDVPTKADYQLFRPAHVELLRRLFAAGVQDFTAISDTCRGDFVSALHGETPPIFEQLLEVNGSTLELHMPKGKLPVLAAFPSEHASHITWQVSRLLEEPNLTPFALHAPALFGATLHSCRSPCI